MSFSIVEVCYRGISSLEVQVRRPCPHHFVYDLAEFVESVLVACVLVRILPQAACDVQNILLVP